MASFRSGGFATGVVYLSSNPDSPTGFPPEAPHLLDNYEARLPDGQVPGVDYGVGVNPNT